MSSCPITNSKLEEEVKKTIGIEKYDGFMSALKSLIPSVSGTVDMNVTDTSLEKPQALIKFVKDFTDSSSSMSFLSYISTDETMKKKFNQFLNQHLTVPNAELNERLYYVLNTFYSFKDEWNKFCKQENKRNSILNNISYKTAPLFTALVSVANKVNTGALGNVSNDFKSMLNNTLSEINELSRILAESASEIINTNKLDTFKKLAFKYLGFNREFNSNYINFDLDPKQFDAQLKALVRSKLANIKPNYFSSTIKKVREKLEEVDKLKVKGKNFDKINATIKSLEFNAKELELVATNVLLNKTSGFGYNNSVILDYLVSKAKDLYNEYHKNNSNHIDCSNSVAFPWYKQNNISDKQFNEVKSIVGDGVAIDTFVDKIAESKLFETDDTLNSYLKNISKEATKPIVKILKVSELSETSKLLTDIKVHENAFGHKPSAMYVHKNYNKAQTGNDFDCIYIIDDGTTDHNFSMSGITHEWLHCLTDKVFVENHNFSQAISILRNKTDNWLKKSADWGGIDKSKIPMVIVGSREIPYALTNDQEFVSEAFNNPEFQKLLDKIESPFKQKNKKQSLWQWLLEQITSFIDNILHRAGHKDGTNTVLSEILITGGAAMRIKTGGTQLSGDIKTNSDYGTFVLPTALPEVSDYMNEVISTCEDLSIDEEDLVRKCNTVITPIYGKNKPYKFSSKLIDTYNSGNESTNSSDKHNLDNTAFTDETIALIHIRDNASLLGTANLNTIKNDAINQALKVLNSGGRIITYSKDFLDSHLTSNQVNAQIYQALAENTNLKPYIIRDTAIWVQEPMSDEERKEILLDARKLDMLNPSVKVNNGKVSIHPTLDMSELLKKDNSRVIVKPDNPLYEQLKAINTGTTIRIHTDVMYYGVIKNITEKSNGVLEFAVDLQTSEYTDLNTTGEDISIFDSTETYEVDAYDNVELKLGSEKTNWRINSIANDIIEKIRVKLTEISIPEGLDVENSELNKLKILFSTTKYDAVLQELKDHYQKYIEDDKYRLDYELTTARIEDAKFDLGQTEDELLSIAQELAPAKADAYNELMPYFEELSKRATKKVASELGIKITFYTDALEEDSENTGNDGSIYTSTENNDTNESQEDETDDQEDLSEGDDEEIDSDVVGKDHWIVSTSNQDIHDTLNIRIRKLLSDIVKTDATGENPLYDDIGNVLYEDERDVFNNLLEICKGLQSIEAMIDKITKYAENGHGGYFAVVDTINSSEELKSLFFTGLCSQAKRIESATVVKDENGNENTFLKHANKDSRYEWIETAVNSAILSKKSGTIFTISNRHNIASKLASELTGLRDEVKAIGTRDRKNLLRWLSQVGINFSEEDLEKSIRRDSVDLYKKICTLILPIAEKVIKLEDKEELTYAPISGYYKNLKEAINESIPTTQQTRTYCDGKLYPSYNKPSYISKMLDTLAGLDNNHKDKDNKTERQRYMDRVFKQFSQYYTKNNLSQMIEAARKNAESDSNYYALVSYLEALNSDKISDKEISDKINYISRYTDEKTALMLNNLVDNKGNQLQFRKGHWNYSWLQDIYYSKGFNYELSDMLSYEGKQYTKLSEKEYLQSMFLKAKNLDKISSKTPHPRIGITVPIYADANCWNFMYCNAVGDIDKIIDGFAQIMESEIDRVQMVIERSNLRRKAIEKFNKLSPAKRKVTSIGSIEGFSYPIPNYDIMCELKYNSDGTIDLDTFDKSVSKDKNRTGCNYMYFTYEAGQGSMKAQIKNQLETEYNKFLDYVKNQFAVKGKKETTYPGMPSETFLRNFYYEHCYATAQIHSLTSSPVFYKNAVDFQKRYKEVYALTTRLNTHAKGGRLFERSITLSDRLLNNFEDAIYKALAKNFKKILSKSQHLTEATKQFIIKQLSQVNATDAQAIRTPSSYIAIKLMLGEWGDKEQAAWSALNSAKYDSNNKFDLNNLRLLMGVIKPFVRSNYIVDSKTDYGDIKVPIQHKNSEFMSPYGSGTRLANTTTDQILTALTDFMEENMIDIANFESAVKVGNQAPIDLNECKSYQDAMDMLYKATGIKKGDSNRIKKGIQNETEDKPFEFGNPEVIKAIPYSDWGVVAPNPEHFTDKKMKVGSQIRRVMKADIIPTEEYEFTNVVYEYIESKEVKPEKGEEIVTIAGLTYKKRTEIKKITGKDLLKKYDALIDGNLQISFAKIEKLFNDKDKLAAFLDETIINDDKMPSEVRELLKRDADGNFVNMADPQFGDKIHQILMSKIRHTVTEQKIAGGTCVQVSCMWDDNLSLHFKTDSEGNTVVDYADCYLPLYLKKLYEKAIDENGVINFDILKENLLKKGRKGIETWEALTTMVGYRTPTEGVSSAIPLRVKGFLPPTVSSCIVLPKEITFLSGSDFDVDKLYIMRHEFTIDKDGYPELVTEGIGGANNQLVDLMLGMFQTKQYTERFLNPSGSFSDLEKSVNILNIVNNATAGDVKISDLKQKDPEEIEDFIKEKGIKIQKDNINLTSPRFQPTYHAQNFTGKNMLATWAVYKSAVDLLQYCDIQIADKFQISLNGQKYDKLCPQLIDEKTVKNGKAKKIKVFLTQMIKQYLAASADNTKNPVQYKLGITEDNIKAVAYLSLIGIDSTSVSLLIRAANMCTKEVNTLNRLALNSTMMSLTDDKLAYPDNNVIEAAALIMHQASIAGNYLSDMVSIIREDSQKGALKENIAKQISFEQKIEKTLEKIYDSNSPFIMPKDKPLLNTRGTLSSKVKNDSLIGNVQRFYDYGVRSYRALTREMFPEFNSTFEDAYTVSEAVKNGYLSAKNVTDTTNHLYYYHVLSLPFFGDEVIDGQLVTAKQKIESYKKNMPEYFRSIMIEHPELYDNQFVKRLQLKSFGGQEELILPKAFQYNREDINAIKGAISDLFISNNPEIRKFAWNLLKYSFYRQGFKRKADGYGSFISRSMFKAIEGYTSLMQSLQKGEVSNGSFKSQFLGKGTSVTDSIPKIYKLTGDGGNFNAKMLNTLIDKYVNLKTLDFSRVPNYIVYNDTVYQTKPFIDKFGSTFDDSKEEDIKGIKIKKQESFVTYEFNEFNSDENTKLAPQNPVDMTEDANNTETNSITKYINNQECK